MSAARTKHNWEDVVALMRKDVRDLADDPAHAARILLRYQGSLDSLTAQFRRAWGLNAHELQAITTLWEFGRMTMTELGRRIPLSRAAVTTLTDRLERLELVKRVADPTDRRRIQLEVTDKVDAGFERINAHWNAQVEAYVRDLDPTVWASFVGVLADLREMARAEADELRAQAPDDAERNAGERRRAAKSKTDVMPPSWS